MATLIMLKGLPASGKTTWAKGEVRVRPHSLKIVNKDLLREMLHDNEYTEKLEKDVLMIRNVIIQKLLLEHLDVICDDCNLNPEHEMVLRRLAEGVGANFVVHEFNTPLEVCTLRDELRPLNQSVGVEAIYAMHKKYIEENNATCQ